MTTMLTYRIAAYPKSVRLRDGSVITIRPLQPDDGEGLLEFFLGVPEGDRFYLKDDVTSPKIIQGWLEHLNYKRALPLLALFGSRIVADGVLIRRRGGSRSHIGEVRVVVAPEFRGRGLGTTLLRELCDIANEEGLEKVVLELVAENETEAMQAAKWLGFIHLATLEGMASDQQGHHHDVMILQMPLGKWYAWTKF